MASLKEIRQRLGWALDRLGNVRDELDAFEQHVSQAKADVAANIAAPAEPDSTTEEDSDVPSTITRTVSERTPGASTSGVDFPNEPSAVNTLVHESFQETYMTEACEAGVSPATVTGWTGEWGNYHGYSDSPQGNIAGCTQNNFSVQTGTAPISNDFHRTLFPQGLVDGRTPGKYISLDEQDREFDWFYTVYVIRYVDPGSGDWESSRGVKQGFWGVGDNNPSSIGVGNSLFARMIGEGGAAQQNDFESNLQLDMRQQNVVSRALGRNVTPGAVIPVGDWHRIEFEFVLNDIGSANGELRVWTSRWDGSAWENPIQLMNHTDVTYRDSNNPNGFSGWKWDPTWGSWNGNNKQRDDHIDIAYVYIKGRELTG